jgi:hypothetical protein
LPLGTSELPHERQKANLAEPLVLKIWSRCTDKNLTDFAKNGVFQHYQPNLTDAAYCMKDSYQ